MRYLFLLNLILIYISGKSQDGKIIEQIAYSLPDSIIKRDAKYFDFDVKLLDSVNFYHITYLSDGLKIKGYISVTKKKGKYQCIISNRGGNRENSAIT